MIIRIGEHGVPPFVDVCCIPHHSPFYSHLCLYFLCVTSSLGLRPFTVIRWTMAHIMPSSPSLRYLLESWKPRASSRPEYLGLSGGDDECLLEQEKGATLPSFREKWRPIRHARMRRYIALVGATVSLLLLLALAFQKRTSTFSHEQVARNAQRLHLLIPSPDLNRELCKAALSAKVLHYSTPTLVRWDPTEESSQANTLRRMTAVRNHLENIARHDGNDTVVLMDSISTWFQLRPETLLKRYYDINRSAMERLALSMGPKMVAQDGIRQSIVFSASPNCGATSTQDRGCQSIPASPLSRGTSQANASSYLTQGVTVGPAKDLYEVYRRGVAIIERSSDFEDELQIFSEVFGQQEYQRSLLRRQPRSWLEQFGGLFSAEDQEPQSHNVHPDEFGIGLDYAGELSLNTENAPDSFTRSHHSRLPLDITFSMPPFWTPSGQDLPSEKTWTDLGFLTNAQTQSIPAMIQHSMSASHKLRRGHWENLWLQPHSRKLLDAYMAIPTMPLATVRDNENVQQIFWSTMIGEKAGVKVADGPWISWEQLCPGEELAAEIFGDELGVWQDPLP